MLITFHVLMAEFTKQYLREIIVIFLCILGPMDHIPS